MTIGKGNPASTSAANTWKDIIPPTNPFLSDFLDLLHKMFAFDPNNRITAREALRHNWFQQGTRDDGTEAARLHAERASVVR